MKESLFGHTNDYLGSLNYGIRCRGIEWAPKLSKTFESYFIPANDLQIRISRPKSDLSVFLENRSFLQIGLSSSRKFNSNNLTFIRSYHLSLHYHSKHICTPQHLPRTSTPVGVRHQHLPPCDKYFQSVDELPSEKSPIRIGFVQQNPNCNQL